MEFIQIKFALQILTGAPTLIMNSHLLSFEPHDADC